MSEIFLSLEDTLKFIQELANPSKPNARLLEAVERHKDVMDKIRKDTLEDGNTEEK